MKLCSIIVFLSTLSVCSFSQHGGIVHPTNPPLTIMNIDSAALLAFSVDTTSLAMKRYMDVDSILAEKIIQHLRLHPELWSRKYPNAYTFRHTIIIPDAGDTYLRPEPDGRHAYFYGDSSAIGFGYNGERCWLKLTLAQMDAVRFASSLIDEAVMKKQERDQADIRHNIRYMFEDEWR